MNLHSKAPAKKNWSSLLLYLPVIFILTSSGCLPILYRTNTTQQIGKDTLAELIKQKKYFVLHVTDPEVQKGIQSLTLTEDTIKGILVDLPVEHSQNLKPDPKKQKNLLRGNIKNGKIGLTEVHLYTRSKNESDSGLLLPLSSIERMDVYEFNEKATRRNHRVSIVGLIVLTAGLVVSYFILEHYAWPE